MKDLSPYAQQILDRSLDALNSSEREHTDPDTVVKAIVSELYTEVGPNRWDGTVNAALIEIVQSVVVDMKNHQH